ncbi:mCG1041092 [Mus musculus]|nr:mCG1041092 [Mus musculus]
MYMSCRSHRARGHNTLACDLCYIRLWLSLFLLDFFLQIIISSFTS